MLGIGFGLTTIRYPGIDRRVASLSPTAWYDPSDLSTLWQDTGKTTAVTAADDPVRVVEDISGNGNDLVAPSDAARPLYKTAGGLRWLEFDGTDDAMADAFTLVRPWERITALRVLTYVNSTAMLDGYTLSGGRLRMIAPDPGLNFFAGSSLDFTDEVATGNDFVATMRGDGSSSRVAIDGNAYATGNAGTNDPDGVSVGARGGLTALFSNMRYYGDFIKSGTMSDADIATVRTWAAGKAGVSL